MILYLIFFCSIIVNVLCQTDPLSYGTDTYIYTKDTTIANLVPTYDTIDAGTEFTALALPSGLVIDIDTGVISGTPDTVTAEASYSITVANSGTSFSNTLVLTITINDIIPSLLYYSASNFIFYNNIAVSETVQTYLGGAPTSYSIKPSLPSNLNFNTNTGKISGTPNSIFNGNGFTITATNSGGSTTTWIYITIIE